MALDYVFDEHLRGPLFRALLQHNAAGSHVVDVVRVGDPADLPLGTKDPDVLIWAERAGRVLVSIDKRTMPGHLAAHLQTGRHSPGIFLVRPGYTIPVLVDLLVIAAYTTDPLLIRDRYEFIP
jgi:hypothetical protein